MDGRPDDQAEGLADERHADQDPEGEEQAVRRQHVLLRLDDVGQQLGGHEHAEGETHPRCGAGEEAQPEAAPYGGHDDHHDDEVEEVHAGPRQAVIRRAGGPR